MKLENKYAAGMYCQREIVDHVDHSIPMGSDLTNPIFMVDPLPALVILLALVNLVIQVMPGRPGPLKMTFPPSEGTKE